MPRGDLSSKELDKIRNRIDPIDAFTARRMVEEIDRYRQLAVALRAKIIAQEVDGENPVDILRQVRRLLTEDMDRRLGINRDKETP
jgi:hypothetical protein